MAHRYGNFLVCCLMYCGYLLDVHLLCLQVTVQTESERQLDKIRRKEEKRGKRGVDTGNGDIGVDDFSSLLLASERKQPFDDVIGTGEGADSFTVTSLPQGTTRKHMKGYEEVKIPPTPTASLKPNEKLVDILVLSFIFLC
jgi:activating signal cointegrator complex subunit 3